VASTRVITLLCNVQKNKLVDIAADLVAISPMNALVTWVPTTEILDIAVSVGLGSAEDIQKILIHPNVVKEITRYRWSNSNECFSCT
jgi:hypothetical protein